MSEFHSCFIELLTYQAQSLTSD